jgi:hypothetical protein
MATFLLSLVFMCAVIGGAGRWAQLKQARLAGAADPESQSEEV